MRTYRVPGISCEHCKSAIEQSLAGLAEISAVDVDIDAKVVHIHGDAPDADIVAAIGDAGYAVDSG